MVPATSEVNLTPTSTGLLSLAEATVGVVAPLQIVTLAVAEVVKDQVTGAAIGLPDRSLAPLTVAV